MKLYKITSKLKKLVALSAVPLFFISCGGSLVSTSSTSSSSVEASAFPSSLAVASPFDYTTSSTSSTSSSLTKFAGIGSPKTTYIEVTEDIATVLAAGSSSICTFSPEEFLIQSVDADCYGPAIKYEDHPDGSGSSVGELPPGDVGIWLETDPVTSDACAASQLEARLKGVQARSNASLVAMATMICATTTAGKTLPDASTPVVDILTEMNALGITDTTFSTADLTYDATSGSYSYTLNFDYAPLSVVHVINLKMTHTPTSTGYEGVVSFLVDDTMSGGNCPTSDITHNGSVEYKKLSTTEMKVQARSGEFCENGSNGLDSNGIVDATKKYSSSTPTGWGNNFDIFTSNYDPADLDGDYSYAWQAGNLDGNTRVININVANAGQDGIAFYGYGDDVAITNGSIDGFICNWAGPSNDHTIIEYAQYQAMSVDATTGQIVSDAVNIAYAPTVSCEYDGTGTFLFDTDADKDLTDEDYTLVVNNGLYEAKDIDGDSVVDSIEDNIADAGFLLPLM